MHVHVRHTSNNGTLDRTTNFLQCYKFKMQCTDLYFLKSYNAYAIMVFYSLRTMGTYDLILSALETPVPDTQQIFRSDRKSSQILVHCNYRHKSIKDTHYRKIIGKASKIMLVADFIGCLEYSVQWTWCLLRLCCEEQSSCCDQLHIQATSQKI